MSQLAQGVARTKRRNKIFSSPAEFSLVDWPPVVAEVWIERYFARLLERRIAEEQSFDVIQDGLLLLEVHYNGIRLGAIAWILRVQILEVLKIDQIHIGVVERRLRAQQQQLHPLQL